MGRKIAISSVFAVISFVVGSQGDAHAAAQSVDPSHQAFDLSAGSVEIGNAFTPFQDWKLKKYHQALGKSAAPVDLSSVTHVASRQAELGFDTNDLLYLRDVRGNLKTENGHSIWTYEDGNVRITRSITASQDQPYVGMEYVAEFKSPKTQPKYAFVTLRSVLQDEKLESQDNQLAYFANQDIERQRLEKLDPGFVPKEISGPVKWVGTLSRYFILALIPHDGSAAKAVLQATGAKAGQISLVYPVTQNKITIPLRVYFGPKEIELMRSVEPTLDHAVDFGWFTFFAYPILQFMRWLYHFFHNYGVAIIVLTVLLKVVTYPLTYKSMKSMRQMAKVQPQIQKIREKYKDDREAMNREIMALMKGGGYNPMAGCLPMLIQLPIFFALYRVLYGAVELYQAPFALWIHDLSLKDPYYVFPILLMVTMFIQQKLSPSTATDPAQQRMLQFMPIIFGAMMLTLPSGLTVYMVTNALTSIIQQLILNKKLNLHAPATVARA